MRKTILLGALCLFAIPAFSQSVSPFTAPPYTTSQLPMSAPTGAIVYNSTFGGLEFGLSSNWFSLPYLSATATTSGNLATYANTSGELSATGQAFSATPGNNTVVESNGSGQLAVGWFPATLPTTCIAGTGGTTANTVVKLNSSGQCIAATNSDTADQLFIATNTVSSSGVVYLAVAGSATCVMNSGGGSTALHYAVLSNSGAPDCADGGTSPPAGYFVLGQFSTSTAANGNATVFIGPGYVPASGGSGITSASLTMPGIFMVGGSPITPTSGTFAVTLATEATNSVWGGPCSGSAATPTFRGLCYADLTSPTYSQSPSWGSSMSVNLGTAPFVQITLGGSTTTIAVTGATTGMSYTFHICEPGGGGDAVTWTGFHGAMVIDASAPATLCAQQTFHATGSTTLYADAPGVMWQ